MNIPLGGSQEKAQARNIAMADTKVDSLAASKDQDVFIVMNREVPRTVLQYQISSMQATCTTNRCSETSELLL